MEKILIITFSDDNECIQMVTDAVKAKKGEVYRFNTDLYPTGARISLVENNDGRNFILSSPEGELNMKDVTAVWYRRSRIGQNIPKTMDPQLRDPSVKESLAVFHGFMESLDTFILDSYHKIRYAAHKQLQLKIAREVGLDIPHTLTTNDPENVRKFFNACKEKDGMITKMLSSFAVYEGDKEKVVFTNRIEEKDLEDLDGLALCPMTFQENIPKKMELRVTIVGNKIFSAAIDSQASELAQNDWRRDGLGLVEAWKEFPLPPEIESKLLKLMDALQLNYGAVDFILTPDNRYVFLEINPAGEFFWLELNNPKFPISSALAGVLLGESPRR